MPKTAQAWGESEEEQELSRQLNVLQQLAAKQLGANSVLRLDFSHCYRILRG